MDLNLIRVFVAVFEAGTVTAAATQLHMAQPSVTQALNRLRQETGEALFTRSGRGIAPTRAARQLYEEVGGMPAAIAAAIRGLTAFQPSTTKETFRLALTDLGQTLFLPALGQELSRVAPDCKLDVVNLDVATLPDELRDGTIDLAVASSPLASDLRTSIIRHDLYCCVARNGRFGGRTPTLEQLTVVPRVVAKGSIGHTLVESELPKPVHGSMFLPAFSAIPAVIAATDLIAFVPSGVVRLWAKPWNLDAWTLPPEKFTSSVRAHRAQLPVSSASAWFTDWAIATLRNVREVGPVGRPLEPAGP